MSKYKTKDGSQTGVVPGVGEIVNGILSNAPDNLENPNLELVADPKPVTPTPTAPVATVASPPTNTTEQKVQTNEENK